jgi:hypothetical protein
MPPPLPPRPGPVIAISVENNLEVLPEPEAEARLSDKQLQELYDNEEIDRFLDLFSAVSGTDISLPITV